MPGLHFGGCRRVPSILQTEAAECGLACLAMVAAYHGYDTDLRNLRRHFPISLKGTNLQQLIEIGQQIDLGSRPLRCEIDELPAVNLPAILHWDLNHFVVLTKIMGTRYEVHDPARGVVRVTRPELAKHFTGIVLELNPTREFIPKVEKQFLSLWSFWRSTQGLGTAVTQILLLALALEIFAIVAPLYQQLVIDQAIVAADRDLLVVLALGFGLLMLVQISINTARSCALLYLGTTLNLQLVRNLFRHLLQLPMDYFEKRHLGDISSRFGSLDVIQRTLTTSFLAAIIDGVLVLGTLMLMFIYSAPLALITVLAVLLYALLRAADYQPLRQAAEEVLVRGAKQQSNFLESVRGIQSIKLFSREGQRQSVYENLLVKRTNADIKTHRLAILFQFANGLLFGLENILVIFFGARLVLDGGFSIGMLFAFLSYKLQFTQRAAGLIDKAIELRMLNLHAERIADIALTPREQQAHGSILPVLGSASIELKNVSFRYGPQDKPVIERLSLKVFPGEIVAITGPSGCGKTTLMKVILGLLRPEQGEVLIGDQNIDRLDPQSYRSLLGTVMQDDTLFAGSILDNIAFFDSVIDLQRVAAATTLATIHDDITRMPMQYNTIIGDMGSTLSGGQRQRVILARALYRQPKILLLDEATSHVDVMQEHAISHALSRLGLTIVVIAHRPETINSAHRVIDFVAAN